MLWEGVRLRLELGSLRVWGCSKLIIGMRIIRRPGVRFYINPLSMTFLLIDIREYYDDKKSGEEKPGKKGISLNPDQWNALVSESANILGLFA